MTSSLQIKCQKLTLGFQTPKREEVFGPQKHTQQKHPTSGGWKNDWKTFRWLALFMPQGYPMFFLGQKISSTFNYLGRYTVGRPVKIPSSTLWHGPGIPSSVPIISHLLSGNHSTDLCWIRNGARKCCQFGAVLYKLQIVGSNISWLVNLTYLAPWK